jgi:selenide,water dikinase
LAQVLQPLISHPASAHPDLVVGVATSDDAGVYRIAPDRALVQTVDFFTPIVDDAYDWGRIAAANALSDVYAMGGQPVTALQLVAWPRETISFDILGDVLRGGLDVMASAGTTIVGGHSIDDQEPKYGFAVTGFVHPDEITTNAAARAGDKLVLTKPLGMGVAATALKRQVASGALAEQAVDVMVTLNAGAGAAMTAAGVRCATDVTGFGLLGHLREMVDGSGVGAVIDSAAVPVLDTIADLVADGVYPGGSLRNLESVRPILDSSVDDVMIKILADAQTSGGLLMAVPDEALDGLLRELEGQSPVAVVIGEIVEGAPRIAVR